jgi:hypothetical protein
MSNKHGNISVDIYWDDSCQGNRKQRQQSVLKIAKSTVEVHSVWHDIYIATEAGGQMRVVCITPCACARARDLSRDAQILPQ